MKKGELRKKIITEKMADHILSNGLQSSSLRQISAAAETSDRMLLYYFTNKEDMLTATLNLISERFIELLNSVQFEQMYLRTRHKITYAPPSFLGLKV